MGEREPSGSGSGEPRKERARDEGVPSTKVQATGKECWMRMEVEGGGWRLGEQKGYLTGEKWARPNREVACNGDEMHAVWSTIRRSIKE